MLIYCIINIGGSMANEYSGELFLDRLYKDLYNSSEVQHGKTKKYNRGEAIRKYMERLEKVHGPNTSKTVKKLLRKFYYDKYVIKESVLGDRSDSAVIIQAQEKSLDAWLDYLTDENAMYPMWAKYWAFQGMLKLGTYDDAHEVYQRRSAKTINPFVEANPEIISACIAAMINYVRSKQVPEADLSHHHRLFATQSQHLYTVFLPALHPISL